MDDAISDLVKLFGGQMQTAKALGVSQPTVNGWVNGKHGVSAETALKAERISGGKIKAVELCLRLDAAMKSPEHVA